MTTPMTPQHDIEELRQLVHIVTNADTDHDAMQFITAYCQKREAALLDRIDKSLVGGWYFSEKDSEYIADVLQFERNSIAKLSNQQPSIENPPENLLQDEA